MSNISQSSQHFPTDDHEKSLKELPKARFWDSTFEIHKWEGFWLEPGLIKPAMRFRSSFQARDDDVLLASSMKTGTTWLKSLALCITRSKQDSAVTTADFEDDLLTRENPHFLLPTIESTVYSTKPLQYNINNIYEENPISPRLMHTHLPYTVLPESLKNSRCKIVYVARNPKDTLISIWHFFNSILRKDQEPYPLSKLVDCFCSGEIQYGRYFDHVLEYWLQSKKSPEKILFVKYEEMKIDPKGQVRAIAEFLGERFESEAEIDEILWRCSLDRLKSLEVNRSANSVLWNVPNSSYFRKGVVGDSKNYLTREMEEKIDRMSRDKFEPHGLFF